MTAPYTHNHTYTKHTHTISLSHSLSLSLTHTFKIRMKNVSFWLWRFLSHLFSVVSLMDWGMKRNRSWSRGSMRIVTHTHTHTHTPTHTPTHTLSISLSHTDEAEVHFYAQPRNIFVKISCDYFHLKLQSHWTKKDLTWRNYKDIFASKNFDVLTQSVRKKMKQIDRFL